MKRLTVLLLIFGLLVGAVYGQGIRNEPRSNDNQRSERQRDNDSQRAENRRSIDPVTVEGTLKLERGFVALQSSDTVYIVPTLNRYIGFINGLSEGARVSVEGREFRNTILPTKVTIAGRSYDFPANNFGPGFENRNFAQRRDNVGPNRGNFGQSRRNGPNRNNCCR